MNTLSIDGWRKPDANAKSIPIGELHFRVHEKYHLMMEKAEQELAETHQPEAFIDVDKDTMELETPNDCGDLVNCRFRVYLDDFDHRGHFHLVAERAGDHSLVYSNAVMVDQLG